MFSFSKHSAHLSSQRSPWSRLVRERGALCPAQLCRDQLSQMQAGEQRAGFMGPHPAGPCAGRAPFQSPSHGLCGIKSLLIILILNIKLKWKVHFGRLGSIGTEEHDLCKRAGQALALVSCRPVVLNLAAQCITCFKTYWCRSPAPGSQPPSQKSMI